MDFDTLSKLAFFEGLTEADLALLAPFFRVQHFNAGIAIFEQGERAEYLYLVARGEVVIRYKPEDGPAMTVTRVQPGGVFGWSAAMGNQTYTSGAICTLDSEVLQIRGAALHLLCEKHPKAGKIILDRLTAVVAERQKSRQQVTSLLANGIRQQPS